MASFQFSSIVLPSSKTESELQAVPTQLLADLSIKAWSRMEEGLQLIKYFVN